ncbi:Hsp20 family protein [Streptomyces sp. GbtcB6]|uniref:Hsp20 family protein n=1 Tax=Streptomyces sp. GbtcB6 TaxID=2824751 RepID=UPI001C2FCDDC|nr:Hsp20 family protein [Streptomyces sp. GbtcB6]
MSGMIERLRGWPVLPEDTFARSVRLPAGARGDEAAAAYKDGVLTVTVPVPVPEEKTGTRTIPVRTG